MKNLRSSRAVILPTPCDPYIMQLWLASYEQWKHLVSKLYIHINTKIDQDIVDFVTEKAKALGAEVIYVSKWMDHGRAIRETLPLVQEEHCLLLEDDLYVLTPSMINDMFVLLEDEQFDVIGSPRGSASMEIIEATRRAFPSLPKYLSTEVNLWPCLFFSKTDLLRTTDLHFGPKTFKKGESILPLNFVPDKDLSGDTFVWTSIQLYAKGYRLKYINQMRHTVSGYNFYPPDSRINFMPEYAPWIHTGTSSSGIHGLLLDDNNRLLGFRNDHSNATWKLPDQAWSDQGLRRDYARRIAFWTLCSQQFSIKNTRTEYFNKVYTDAIMRAKTHLVIPDEMIGPPLSFFSNTLKPLLAR